MKFVREEVNPTSYVERGILDVDDAGVRDNINVLLTGALSSCTLTPYIALEKVRKVLAYFHIHLDKAPFMEGDRGVQVFDVHQFGRSVGMRNDGEVVTKVSQPYSIYFEYQQNEKGMFDIFCEIVTQDELDDLIDDAEEDINDDDTVDDRDERLQVKESKAYAMKVLNELRSYNPDGTYSIDLPRPPPTGTNLRGYEKMLPNNISDIPHDDVPGQQIGARGPLDNQRGINKPVDTGSESLKSNPAFQKSGGDGPPVGTDPFKGVTPRRMDDPGYGELPSGPNSMHSSTPIPSTGYNLPNKQQSGPAPGSFRAAQEIGIQQQKSQMQETSHESVNHVRRLAMKKKINETGETGTMWNTALDKAKELSGYKNIRDLYKGIRQGDTDAALQSAGKAALGVTPFVKPVQIVRTLSPHPDTSSQELDQIKDAGMANARRLAPASARTALETGIQQQKSQMQETSHESVNHVRRLAMKNKRNDR